MKRNAFAILMTAMTALGLLGSTAAAGQTTGSSKEKPTIVLVHGAFAESSSWNGVIDTLTHDGYPVVATANPLRGVASDAAYVARVIGSIRGPVVLVGHSYGGAVISATAPSATNIKALVYVAAFAPDTGETSLELTGKFPGSTLSGTLAPPVALPGGTHDLYIDQAKFPHQFAADVPLAQAKQMTATQRPIVDAALAEKSTAPAWKSLPSWSIYGTADLNIPPAALAFMAQRAHSTTTVVQGASHVVMVSHPKQVAAVIEAAAQGVR